MAAEWHCHEVSDLIHAGKLFVGDGYRAKNEELATHGLPFARAGNINEGFRFDGADHFPERDLARVGNKVSRPGDVVFTSKGTVGRFAFVRPETPRFVYSPQLCFWRSLDPDVILPRFLYYWMYGWEFFVQFKGVAGQTDMAEYVSLADQRRMHASLPLLPEQRAIARVLGALDDKLELNRRMNRTLEALARALFKAWFVDFEPVRAKMAGRPPQSCSPEVAALFPDALAPSELGLIPKGWRVSTIGRAVRAVGGATPSTKEPAYWDEGHIHWATPKDLSVLPSPVLLDTARKITQAGLRCISSGLLPVGTVLLSSRAPVGYVAFAGVPTAINQGFIAMVCDGAPSNYYVYNWTHHAMPEIRQRAGGTTFAEISKLNFRPIPMVLPNRRVIDAFDQLVEPMYRRITGNERECYALTRLRDALLPKLISGQVRMKDTERIAEEVSG